MVDLYVNDITNALKNGCYFSALAMTLALPDICGAAEYPDETSVGKRYIEWYDKFHVLIFGIGTLAKFLIFSGQVILSLLIFTEESGTHLFRDKPCDLVLIHALDQTVKLLDAVINIPKSFLCRIVTLCLIALLVGEELLTNVRLIQHQVDLSPNICKHKAFKKFSPDRMRGVIRLAILCISAAHMSIIKLTSE